MKSNVNINTRFIAFKILNEILNNGISLNKELSKKLLLIEDKRDKKFIYNLVVGVLRWNIRLESIINQLLKKPFKNKDKNINLLIQIGLYQIIYMEVADHAAVSETVLLTNNIKKTWAKNIVNAILRNFIRKKLEVYEYINLKPSYLYSHPEWFIQKIKTVYPLNWEEILKFNNSEPTIFLRTNTLIQTRNSFLKKLIESGIDAESHPYSLQGIKLNKNYEISKLPSYDEGGFSVQDISAQQAAIILNPKSEEYILDACAAPGGKTTHIQELSLNKSELIALEKNEKRIKKLKENIKRLNLTVKVIQADANEFEKWWNGKLFDKILLDAPCSATGIIRRNPDIKKHRTEKDIANLIKTQKKLLKSLWDLLKPGGKLLYVTCSVLPEENSNQINSFLKATKTSSIVDINMQFSYKKNITGEQILPGTMNIDGFYYALLQKK